MPHIGQSIGVIITTKNIKYIKDMDDSALIYFDILGVVDFYIFPHFEEFTFKEKINLIIRNYKNSINLLTINNQKQ